MTQDAGSLIAKAVSDHQAGLFHFIRRRVQTDEDAEDILQDVWYQFSNMINVAPVEQISAWLYKVAQNKVTDRYRKKTEVSYDAWVADDEDEDEIDFREILLRETATPETEYLRSLFWQQLYVALGELPEEQREVFIWHELEDMPFEEIAAATGEKVNTLISRKYYATRYLRKQLHQLYTEITQY